MRLLLLGLIVISPWVLGKCPDWLNHDMLMLRSQQTVNICEIAEDKTLLIVNTASKCGFTPQFKGLEALHKKYKDRGLVIIGFPSDDFLQEYDDSAETANVCYVNYGVTFLMLESSAVWGSNVNPIFNYLGKSLGAPRWNFNKYLIDKNGIPIKRFGASTKPSDKDFIKAIEQLLKTNKKKSRAKASPKVAIALIE